MASPAEVRLWKASMLAKIGDQVLAAMGLASSEFLCLKGIIYKDL